MPLELLTESIISQTMQEHGNRDDFRELLFNLADRFGQELHGMEAMEPGYTDEERDNATSVYLD